MGHLILFAGDEVIPVGTRAWVVAGERLRARAVREAGAEVRVGAAGATNIQDRRKGCEQ